MDTQPPAQQVTSPWGNEEALKFVPSVAGSISSASVAATEMADPLLVAKLCEILEAVGDRVVLRKNVGEQRNNWNSFFLDIN
ncbi:hypothetical protein MLD38_010547 [Melastoma candidum]|uniref:Uncharacterized protein n=1 Tax=Melastoma candidum TaxID=119954 RepID=A0ACB9QZM3_9MYRT|nr:hypothetical protein MLD38_010547 [Melastoma candidum]